MDISPQIRYLRPVQHPEALRVIRRLGPELAKSAAEDVLLKHATEEDLAPAQLEKLAQAYNMVRQLSHIERAEDRGSSCYQIDVPALAKRYTTGGVEKAAAVAPSFSRPTHDSSVDLMRELRSEINPVTKSASNEQPGSIEITHPEVPAPSPEAAVTYTPAQMKSAAWEAKIDLYLSADEVLKAASCEGRHLQMEVAERDAMRQVNPVCVKGAMDWLEKYASQQKISRLLTRHEGPVKATAFPISSPLADKLVTMVHDFTVSSLLSKAADDAGIEIGNIPKDDAVNASAEDDMFAKLDAAVPDTPPASTGVRPSNGDPTAALEGGRTRVREDAEEKERGGKDGGGGGGSPEPRGPEKSQWLASLIASVTKPVGAVANTAHAAGESAKGAIRAVTEKDRVHKDQIKLDGDMADISRSILIRRLAANDPVLRDLPLRDVLETYNAIAESNPEVASNPRRVLLAMREAASYEGVTLDAQKSLGDIRGAAAKTDAQENENERRRHTS